MDSQSVKTTEKGLKEQNAVVFDAGKRIKGRKRRIFVDTDGLPLQVVVHSAGIQDHDGAKLLLERCKNQFPRLGLIWADGGYKSKLVKWVKQECGWQREIVKKLADHNIL